MDLTGATTSALGFPVILAVTSAADSPPGSHFRVDVVAFNSNGTPTYRVFTDSGTGDLFSEPEIGHWLVRLVPEPGTASLIVLGLGAMAVGRRRRNA